MFDGRYLPGWDWAKVYAFLYPVATEVDERLQDMDDEGVVWVEVGEAYTESVIREATAWWREQGEFLAQLPEEYKPREAKV